MNASLGIGLASLLALSAPAVASASGAGFTILAQGKELAPAEDADIPAYRLTLPLGHTVTLASQGVVMPRGQVAEPAAADAAAWLFDDAVFELVPHDKKADGTKTVIALKGLKVGRSRVRFVGNLLGYERKYDVLIEVTPPK